MEDNRWGHHKNKNKLSSLFENNSFWYLMGRYIGDGWKKENINKLIASGISNSQLYKLSGNSIVVSCLYHIFRKLLVDTENENIQLTLF